MNETYTASQDLAYKARDHAFRSSDPYARSKYRITTRWLEPWAASGLTLFNIGCGSGEYNAVVVSMGLRVVACEPDAEACAIAARRASTIEHGACEVRCCGLLDLGAHGEQADFIVMHDVLEHIEDDRAAVLHLQTLLRTHGRAVLSVPALPWLFGHHDVRLGHFRRYSAASLRRVLEPTFRIVRLRYFGLTGVPATLWYSVLRRQPYPTGTAGQPPGLLVRAFAGACRMEERLPLPIGTSLLVEVMHR